jgi:hypothetical protein
MSGQLRRPGAAVGAVVFAVNNLYCQVTMFSSHLSKMERESLKQLKSAKMFCIGLLWLMLIR